jgi:hypothetical protein
MDWSDLQQNFGPATDIPALIAAIAASDEAEPTSYEVLADQLYHQGVIPEAAVYAIPLLIDLLQDRDRPWIPAILTLLHVLASGGKTRRVWQEQERHIYTRIAQAYPMYCSLLDHSNPGVREECYGLLSQFVDKADEILALFVQQYWHETGEPKYALVQAIGQLYEAVGSGDAAQAVGFLTALDATGDTRLQYVRLTSLITILSEGTPKWVIEHLLDLTAQEQQIGLCRLTYTSTVLVLTSAGTACIAPMLDHLAHIQSARDLVLCVQLLITLVFDIGHQELIGNIAHLFLEPLNKLMS